MDGTFNSEDIMPIEPLHLSSDGSIGGVCSGIAEFLGWPARRVRLLYVLLSIFSAGFPGLLMYLLLWWIMPTESEAARFQLDDYRVP